MAKKEIWPPVNRPMSYEMGHSNGSGAMSTKRLPGGIPSEATTKPLEDSAEMPRVERQHSYDAGPLMKYDPHHDREWAEELLSEELALNRAVKREERDWVAEHGRPKTIPKSR